MSFDLWVRSDLPAQVAWRAVTDWPEHGRHVPFTTVVRTADGFCASTRLGPITIEDPMRIEGWQPPEGTDPGVCSLVKIGSIVRGRARIEVTPQAGGCTVSWQEDLQTGPRWAARLTGPIVDAFGRRVFGRVLRRLLSEQDG